MKAITICVEYSDMLALTLPYNRHHFSRFLIVTSMTDAATIEVARRYDAHVYATDAFYANGAMFNKFQALEEGLDVLGRDGWITIIDADTAWPKRVEYRFDFGKLYTPLRRMCVEIPNEIPPESEWSKYPLDSKQMEWAGYTQIFHGSDPRLGPAPWHQTNWKHAGGPDSFFQDKWANNKSRVEARERPDFEVLHFGPAGQNWAGRVTAFAGGSTHPAAGERQSKLAAFLKGRREAARRGARDRFAGEKF